MRNIAGSGELSGVSHPLGRGAPVRSADLLPVSAASFCVSVLCLGMPGDVSCVCWSLAEVCLSFCRFGRIVFPSLSSAVMSECE